MRGTYSVSYIKCIILVMVSIFLAGISNHQITYAQQQQPSTNFTSAEQQLLLSGISFQIVTLCDGRKRRSYRAVAWLSTVVV